MRVIGALLVLLSCATASAQGGDPRPVEPNTAVEVAVDAAYEQVGFLDGAQGGVDVAGRVALDPAFELGAGWGARVSGAWLEAGASRVRAGLPPLRAWVGTGGAVNDWRFGLRLEGGVGLAAFDAPDAGSNGEHGYLILVGEAAVDAPFASPRVSLELGAAYAGGTGVSGVGVLRGAVELRPHGWSARPFMGAALFVSTDLGHGVQPAAGVVIDVDASRFAIELRGPLHPMARIVELVFTWRLGLGPTSYQSAR